VVSFVVLDSQHRKAYAEQEYQAVIDIREEEGEPSYVSFKSASRRKSRDSIKVLEFSRV
jgi:hypothetical protein